MKRWDKKGFGYASDSFERNQQALKDLPLSKARVFVCVRRSVGKDTVAIQSSWFDSNDDRLQETSRIMNSERDRSDKCLSASCRVLSPESFVIVGHGWHCGQPDADI